MMFRNKISRAEKISQTIRVGALGKVGDGSLGSYPTVRTASTKEFDISFIGRSYWPLWL